MVKAPPVLAPDYSSPSMPQYGDVRVSNVSSPDQTGQPLLGLNTPRDTTQRNCSLSGSTGVRVRLGGYVTVADPDSSSIRVGLIV